MNHAGRWLLAALLLACTACTTLSPAQRDRALRIAADARDTTVTCDQPDACARPSALRDLGAEAAAASTAAVPVHKALLLDYGQDALLARLSLIRSATRQIDVQTYIFDEDDAGHLMLDELLAAARRGVRVRVLIDQLAALRHVDTLAALSGAHTGFELRLYNPVLGRARINYAQYVLAGACCWRRLNQRMHSKLLLVDDSVGISGGRNYQDDYYDWSDSFNFRDRDVLVAGPVTGEMAENFETFWNARRTRRIATLVDVGRQLLRSGVPALPQHPYVLPDRVARMSRDADDATLVRERLAANALTVSKVSFIADLPQKHRRSNADKVAPASAGLYGLLQSAKSEILLQTPYLVLSPPAQDLFRELHDRADAPRVIVSTNSLAATDAFITYALSYKYKRRYLRDFGFEIHEFKPFPQDAPVDLDATGSVGISWLADGTPIIAGARSFDATTTAPPISGSARRGARSGAGPLGREFSALRWSGYSANKPVRLSEGGVRFGLHAKSMVIDEHIGVVGTHNFDPRGDRYNTESAVVIDDPAFARLLAASIRRDASPANAWTIARRDKSPIFPGLEYSLAKVSEALPIFDLWPVRYATSYEFRPSAECPMPLSPRDPGFRACYEAVGDFPGVDIGLKSLMTRIVTAFGAGLAPIL